MVDIKNAPGPLRDFLIYMETIMGRSRRTVNEYFLDLRTFFRFLLQKRGIVPQNTPFEEISIDCVDLALIASVTRSDIIDYLLFVSRERPKYHASKETAYGNEAKTRARKVSSLRSFYKYLCEKSRLIENNPTLSLDPPKGKKMLPKFLTLSESIKLLENIDGPHKERDYCIIVLFLNCGLRVSELVGINLQDVSEDTLRIFGKGAKERILYLNQACLAAINAYLPKRLTPKAEYKSAMFISQFSRRIDEQTVKSLVKKYLAEAGLAQKKCSAHKLRHTAATLMYQNGVDVRTLKEILGHENLDTTMIYTHVISDNMKDAADKNPLAEIHINKK